MDNFITACKEANLKLVKNLIKDFDLDVNKKDNVGNIGFHYACMNRHLTIAEYFKVDAFACFWPLCASWIML